MWYFGKLLVCSFMVCLFPLLGVAAAELEIPSVKVQSVPEIDGAGGDAVWTKVKPVTVKDSASGTNVLIRSVYTEDQVFFWCNSPIQRRTFRTSPGFGTLPRKNMSQVYIVRIPSYSSGI